MSDAWRVEFSRAAMRDLRRLDRPVRVRILDALERLVTDLASADVRRLSGRSGEWRLRVGVSVRANNLQTRFPETARNRAPTLIDETAVLQGFPENH